MGSDAGPSRPNAGKFAFKGAGYKLGDTEDQPVSVVQGGPVENSPRQVCIGFILIITLPSRGGCYKLGDTEDQPVSVVQGGPVENSPRQVCIGFILIITLPSRGGGVLQIG